MDVKAHFPCKQEQFWPLFAHTIEAVAQKGPRFAYTACLLVIENNEVRI